MASEKDPVCVCVRECVCVWVDCGVRGGLLEADPLTKTPHSIRDLHEYMGTSRAEWESRSRGEVVSGGRGVGGRKRRGAGVWMMGALARWMLVGIKREREKMKETGGRWRRAREGRGGGAEL